MKKIIIERSWIVIFGVVLFFCCFIAANLMNLIYEDNNVLSVKLFNLLIVVTGVYFLYKFCKITQIIIKKEEVVFVYFFDIYKRIIPKKDFINWAFVSHVGYSSNGRINRNKILTLFTKDTKISLSSFMLWDFKKVYSHLRLCSRNKDYEIKEYAKTKTYNWIGLAFILLFAILLLFDLKVISI